MTHSYACHDSFKCVPFLFHILAEAPKYSNIKILACFRVSRTRQHRDIRMFSSSRIPEDTTECNRVGPGMADFLWWVHSGFERIWKFWDNEQGFLMFLEGFLKILGGILKRYRYILKIYVSKIYTYMILQKNYMRLLEGPQTNVRRHKPLSTPTCNTLPAKMAKM